MLKAEHKITNKKFISWDKEEVIKIRIEKSNFICPHCKEKVIFVDGKIKIKHFRHKISSCCNTEPETKEHIEMKLYFINKFKLKKESVEVNLGFARPDIYFHNEKIAIEVQYSPISVDKLWERTLNYSKNNIYVMWVFHDKLLKTTILDGNLILNTSGFLKEANKFYNGLFIYEQKAIFNVQLYRLIGYKNKKKFTIEKLKKLILNRKPKLVFVPSNTSRVKLKLCFLDTGENDGR